MTKYKYKDTDAQIQKTHTQNHMSASKLMKMGGVDRSGM